MSLTPREREALATYVEMENQRLAAEVLGITLQTLKNHLYSAYRQLDANNIFGACKAMGWLEVGE